MGQLSLETQRSGIAPVTTIFYCCHEQKINEEKVLEEDFGTLFVSIEMSGVFLTGTVGNPKNLGPCNQGIKLIRKGISLKKSRPVNFPDKFFLITPPETNCCSPVSVTTEVFERFLTALYPVHQ